MAQNLLSGIFGRGLPEPGTPEHDRIMQELSGFDELGNPIEIVRGEVPLSPGGAATAANTLARALRKGSMRVKKKPVIPPRTEAFVRRRWGQNRGRQAPLTQLDVHGKVTGSGLASSWLGELAQKMSTLMKRGEYGDTARGAKLIKDEFAKELSAEGADQPHPYLMDTLGERSRTPLIARPNMQQVIEYGHNPAAQKRLAMFHALGQARTVEHPLEWEGMLDEVEGMFGGDRELAKLFPKLWAAASPRNKVANNTFEAIAALRWVMENPGVELTKEIAMTHPSKSVIDPNTGLEVYGMGISQLPGTKFRNMMRAFRGQDIHGDKVKAMYEYLIGNTATPIDTHVIYAISGLKHKLDDLLPRLREDMTALERIPKPKGKQHALTITQTYNRLAGIIQETLQGLAPDKSLNEIFGVTWEGSQAAQGIKYAAGANKVLRDLELTHLARRADPQMLTEALKKVGFPKAAIGALMAGLAMDSTEDDEATERPMRF